MGDSFQWLGALSTLEEFVSACRECGLDMRVDDTFETMEDLSFEMGPSSDSQFVGAKEEDGRLYIWAPESVLTSSVDLVVKLSEKLDSKVLSGTSLSTPGAYSLEAADRGRLVRLYAVLYMMRSDAFEKGAPLPTERTCPLDDPSGRGIRLAFSSAGLDYERAEKSGPFHSLVYPTPGPKDFMGPLDEELESFYRSGPTDYSPDIRVNIR